MTALRSDVVAILRGLCGLPTDNLEPHDYASLEALQDRAVMLLDEHNRATAQRKAAMDRRREQDRTRDRKPLEPRRKSDAVWLRARVKVMRRAGGLCEVAVEGCTLHAVHVHHRLMRSQGGGHELSNLLAVCSRCHDWVHSHPKVSYAEGWLLHAEAVS